MTLAEQPIRSHAKLTEPGPRLWTREEYDRLVELGFFANERLELIEGRIIQKPQQRVPHSVTVELVNRYLWRPFPQGFRVCCQSPFLSADGSEPEPDFAVVSGDDPRASTQHPSSAVLIIEISDTSLELDRQKARVYAASAVPEYWIINLVARNLEVHRNPQKRGNDFLYADTQILTGQQQISPAAANLPISISELLP